MMAALPRAVPRAMVRSPLALRVLFLTVLLALILATMAVVSPFFYQPSTLPFLLKYVPVLGLLGMGQALVMIAGGPGIDLSSGAILSLVGLAIASLVASGTPVPIACLAGLLLGAALGAVNGTLIAVLGIPSLMATLATLFVFGGFAVAITGGMPVTGLPPSFGWLGQVTWGGIPVSLIVVLLPVAVVLHVMLTQTTIGSHMIAAGNDETAARLLGVQVDRLRFGLYVLNGILAGLGAIILLSWLLAARPDAGVGFELLAITIAVLGGTHIFGGEGGIPGTILAILIITVLQVGLQLANISPAWQLGIVGLLLLGGVGLNTALEQWRSRSQP